MDLTKPLFNGKLIQFTGFDYEKDPDIEAAWTQNLDTLRLSVDDELAYPKVPSQIKKKYEGIEKRMEDASNIYYFQVRAADDQRLIGYAKLDWILWASRLANIQMLIGDPAERGKGFGSEAMHMLLHFGFEELNLHRIATNMPTYNTRAVGWLTRFGFVEEVRRREAIMRDGRYWDSLTLSILQHEWHVKRSEQ